MGKIKTDKEAICRGGLALFLRKGYRAASLQEIAAALGVTKGALYHHFPNKRELYREALRLFFRENREHFSYGEEPLQRVLAGLFTGLAAKRRALQKMVGSSRDSAVLLLYSFLYEATREFPEFQEAMDRGDDRRRRVLVRLIRRAMEKGEIRQDLEPEITAFEIEALLQQLLYLSFVNPRIKGEEDFSLRLFENYWKRFLPAPENPPHKESHSV